MLWIPFILIAIATGFDLWNDRQIPDTLSVLLLAWAILACLLGWSGVDLLQLLLGAALGFGLAAVLFFLGGLGGADVKLIMALGACLGPDPLLGMLLYVALAGGVLSIVAILRGQKEVAYVPAIAIGLLIFILVNGSGSVPAA
ncbi:MAG: prepilin peptidase [Planctomycetota bacterium]